MSSEITMKLSGFLFLLILFLYFIKIALGNVDDKENDPDAELRKITKSPGKYRVSIIVGFIHHISVITLSILLFIGFGAYNLLLGLIWLIFRVGEGLILASNEKSYWELRKVAAEYSTHSGDKKNSYIHLALLTLQRKYSRFSLAMFCWSIGTLAFSVTLVPSGAVPFSLGVLGIAAGVFSFLQNGLYLSTRKYYSVLSILV